jgi:hypothetical protein
VGFGEVAYCVAGAAKILMDEDRDVIPRLNWREDICYLKEVQGFEMEREKERRSEGAKTTTG